MKFILSNKNKYDKVHGCALKPKKKKKRAAILRVLNTVNFNSVRYLLLIRITNTATHKHTDKS